MVTDTENSNADDKDSVIPPLIYPEDPDDDNSQSDPPSTEPTPDPGPPSKRPTEEPTSEPDYDALSQPYALTREDSMSALFPKYIVR